MPDPEERVAALETAMPISLGPSSRPWTDAELAEFRERFVEAVKQQPIRVIPPEPPLTTEQIRQLLSECVTVVKPGETLVIRGRNWTPSQVREIQQVMDAMHENGRIPFRTLATFGDELGVAQPEAAP